MILNKIKFLLITIFIFSNIQSAILALELLPKKKPVLSKQDIEIKNINGIILPKSKPLVVKKTITKIAKKSKYFSQKDFSYAKEAIKLMEKRNW